MSATSNSRPRVFSHSLVWSIVDLAWVAMTQPAAGAGGAGDASAANQLIQSISLASIDTKLTNPLPVSLSSVPSHAVTNAGTFAVQVTSAPTTAVTGAFYQATQPVSIATAPALVASSAVIGHVIVDTAPTTPVTGTFYQVTQPVSASNLDVALSTRTKPSDQQHVIVDSSATVAVTGAFFQGTQPVSIASMPSTPVTGTFWQVTQPISGTVAVSNMIAAVETGLAKDASLTTVNNSLTTLDTDLKATQPRSISNFPAVQATSAAAGAQVDLASLLVLNQKLFDLFVDIRTELRVANFVSSSGLNVKDDLDSLRADPSFSC